MAHGALKTVEYWITGEKLMVLLKQSRGVLVSAFCASILSACGGGSSDSDSGTGGAAPAPATQTVFNGTQNLTLMALGMNETDSAPFQLAINGNTVTISTDGTVIGSGALSGSNFTVSASDTLTDDGVTCSFALNYSGVINGNTTSGSISGNGTCSDANNNVPVTASGNFNGS